MRRRLPVLLALLLAGAARAAAFDAAALARFDVGYQRCEQLEPQMRGQRDGAWLALWRMPADQSNLARLASLRQGEPYRREQRRFAKASAAPGAPAASSPVAQQCQALQAEKAKADARRAATPAARAASRP